MCQARERERCLRTLEARVSVGKESRLSQGCKDRECSVREPEIRYLLDNREWPDYREFRTPRKPTKAAMNE